MGDTMADAVAAQGQRAKDFPFDRVHKCRIHPGIGIARVGNSPDQHFIGPESPRDPNEVTAPDGSFKDEEGRIKRQGARFRIYAYDKNNKNLGELPLGKGTHSKAKQTAKVEWTVHLANKKGAWYKFYTRFQRPGDVRNAQVEVPDGQEPDSRRSLVIDPGSRSMDGEGKPVGRGSHKTLKFDTGEFLGTKVPLGELTTDGEGRLVVLGGFGHSASTAPNNPIGSDAADDDYWANNDQWYDDISDGPVTATVTLPNGKQIAIDQPQNAAWVIVAPPKYAPGLYPIVSLYDVMREVALNEGWVKDPKSPSFYGDIFPILDRAAGMSWVNQEAQRGHGYDKRGEFRPSKDATAAKAGKKDGKTAKPAVKARVNAALLNSRKLETPGINEEMRYRIVEKLRDPRLKGTEANAQANAFYMPLLSGDGGPRELGKGNTWMSILPSRYRKFEQWRDDDFDPGEKPTYPSFESIADPDLQTDALQRGALEPCVGGAFFPGIEASWTVRHAELYVEAFRINSRKWQAGDITKYMCLPWQADFYDCKDTWWPSARPDDVIPEDVFEEANKTWQTGQPKLIEGMEGRVKWDRGLGVTTLFRRPWHNPADAKDDDPRDSERRGADDMVRYWHELGFVMARKTRWSDPEAPGSEYVFVETERRPHAGMDVRELFHCLLNIDEAKKRTCLPKVEEFVENVLAAARDLQKTASAFAWMDNIRPFDYDEDVFEARMKDIYDDCADFAFTEKREDGTRVPYDPYDPEQNPVFRTREAVTERIRQLTPFNFLDGAWLRNIHRVGPVDEVNSILFTILKEELGDGVPSQNHANIYRDLCHSFGFYPPPMESTAFAYDPVFLDCAFDSPAFQLGISEFSRRYYPEIIGMSLWLEWTVMELHRIASIADMVGLSSHFYRMHIAIDNAASGHGAMIIRAVKQYLRQVRVEGGEKAVQCHWRRIWDGYVAFSYTFVIVIRQVARVLNDPPSLEDQLMRVIKEKAPYGQYNHDKKMMGNSSINSYFADPEAFLQALQHYHYIVPGKPGEGKFFKALEFRGGPMYHVFTEEEIKLWRDWTWELGERNKKRRGPNLRALKERLSTISAPFVDHLAEAKLAAWLAAASEHRIGLWLEIACNEVLGRAQDQAARGAPTKAELDAIEELIQSRFKNWVGWGMIRAATYVAARYRDHVATVTLSLPDPNTKKNLTIPEWFDRIRAAANSARPAHDLLKSFGEELKNRRSLMDDLFADGTPLAYAFNAGIPGNDRKRARDTMAAWLAAGCPLPQVRPGRVKPLRLDHSLNEEECHPTGLSMGFGTVH